MQAPRADLLDPTTKAEILATAMDFLVDKEISTEIKLKGLTSKVLDIETGVLTPTVVNNVMRAVRRVVDQGEADNSAGRLETGDRVYLIEQTEVLGDLKTVDSIVDGDDVFDVIRWETDPLQWFYMIQARRV